MLCWGAEARYRSGPGTIQYIHTGNIAGMHNSADVERRAVSGRREAQFIGATWARPMPR